MPMCGDIISGSWLKIGTRIELLIWKPHVAGLELRMLVEWIAIVTPDLQAVWDLLVLFYLFWYLLHSFFLVLATFCYLSKGCWLRRPSELQEWSRVWIGSKFIPVARSHRIFAAGSGWDSHHQLLNQSVHRGVWYIDTRYLKIHSLIHSLACVPPFWHLFAPAQGCKPPTWKRQTLLSPFAVLPPVDHVLQITKPNSLIKVTSSTPIWSIWYGGGYHIYQQ